jgi:hypothetical protein
LLLINLSFRHILIQRSAFKRLIRMTSLTLRMTLLLITSTLLSITLAHAESIEQSLSHTIEARAGSYPDAIQQVSDKAHGMIMALTVTLILPLGALSWRLLGSVVPTRMLLWIHICCQVLGLAMLVTGFGCGVWAAITHDEVSYNPRLYE